MAAIVQAVSDVLQSDTAGTWAHWTAMEAVVQGDVRVGFHGHCPVVTVRGRARGERSVAMVLAAVARAVSESLELALEDVWVQWIDVEDGRAFTGGRVLS